MTDINAIFQQYLGRAATPDEAAYLQKYINDGNLQAGEIGTILQSHPEYQAKQLESNLGKYEQMMQTNDQAALQRGADIAGAQATSRFASLGRPNSSAMAAQVFGQTGKMAQGLAEQRQAALADFYGRGLENNASMAASQGQNTLGQAYGMRRANIQRQWDIADYDRQQNDYNNYVNSANRSKRASALLGFGGAAAGGVVGAVAGGPMGAVVGSSIGSKLGGLF